MTAPALLRRSDLDSLAAVVGGRAASGAARARLASLDLMTDEGALTPTGEVLGAALNAPASMLEVAVSDKESGVTIDVWVGRAAVVAHPSGDDVPRAVWLIPPERLPSYLASLVLLSPRPLATPLARPAVTRAALLEGALFEEPVLATSAWSVTRRRDGEPSRLSVIDAGPTRGLYLLEPDGANQARLRPSGTLEVWARLADLAR